MKAILIAVLLMVSTVTNFAQANIEIPTILCVIESTKALNGQKVESGPEIFEGTTSEYSYDREKKVASFGFSGKVKTSDLIYKISAVVQREYRYFSDVTDSLVSVTVSAAGINSQVNMAASVGPNEHKSQGLITLELRNQQAVEDAFSKGNPNTPAMAWSFLTMVEDSLRKGLLPDNTIVSATISCLL